MRKRRDRRTERGHGGATPAVEPPANFETLQRRFTDARERYQSGAITAGQYAAELSLLVVTDSMGTAWTLGARTGSWYRKMAGASWVPSTPPLPAGVTPVADPLMGGALLSSVQPPTTRGRIMWSEDVADEVTDEASDDQLPIFSSSVDAIDEHGVWPAEFSAQETRREHTPPWEAVDIPPAKPRGNGLAGLFD
jgi:hypothetical protein